MKSRTAQLVFQSIFVALALVACVGSVGFYDMKFTSDFYIYFTNLSNYLCAGIMIAELIQTARKQGDSYVTAAPRLRVISMLGLVLTFLVFNLLLANDPARDPALNYKVECILCHIVLPILFVADWAMFYEHGKIDWKLPLLSALFPLIYLVYVFLHAALRRFDSSIMNYAGTDPVIYPYFFLNPERVGIGGIILWVGALLAGFVALGYLFMMVDRLLRKRDMMP
ncbi:MAG: Pr6Pr family membrane protein [Clostridia bacterium]|nr:Pr6Pr family membrane protein [Clostridia bacterium]